MSTNAHHHHLADQTVDRRFADELWGLPDPGASNPWRIEGDADDTENPWLVLGRADDDPVAVESALAAGQAQVAPETIEPNTVEPDIVDLEPDAETVVEEEYRWTGSPVSPFTIG